MADRDPVVEEFCAIPQASAIVRMARDDERHKVIADLTNYLDGLDDRLVRKGTLASNTGVQVALTTVRDWAASLLAPEGQGDERNDKDLSAEADADKSDITPPEPARAGEPENEHTLDELRAEVAEARVEIRRMLAGFDWGMGALRRQLEARGHRPIAVSIALNDMLSDGGELEADGDLVLTLRPTAAHEEGSAHG